MKVFPLRKYKFKELADEVDPMPGNRLFPVLDRRFPVLLNLRRRVARITNPANLRNFMDSAFYKRRKKSK